MKVRFLLVLVMALGVVAAACAGTPTMMPDASPYGTPPAPAGPAGPAALSWRQTALKDVATGQAFSLADLRGRVVVVETMAVWCTTCAQQQDELKKVKAQLGDQVAIVSLDIDLGETEDLLKRYVQGRGHDWPFALTSRDFSRQLEREFGPAILNPPSAPLVILDKGQAAHLMRLGLKGSAEVLSEVAKYR